MQYIYAYEISVQGELFSQNTNHVSNRKNKSAAVLIPPVSISFYENKLKESILSVKDQYLYLLLYIREVANYVEKDAKVKASKFLKKDTDLNLNTKLLSNCIIQFLNNDAEFLKEIKLAQTDALLDEDEVRKYYKLFSETTEYKAYLENEKEFNSEEDRKLIRFLLDYILLEDESFTESTEEHFINWMDDAEFVVEAVHEVIERSKNELKLHIEKGSLKEKFKDLSQFGIDLFQKTIKHKKEHQKLIEPKLKNWETDRLAIIDIILIRMAVTEFLFFPSIPLKVSINEYLDIAKEYSTPKSKDFINGVLDAMMKELKNKNKIEKTGRGLI